MTPLVSVVIDNYNYGRYLRQAIQSVLDQEGFQAELECIVVDDGSTDESRGIIASFGDKIRPILGPNRGQATAFNAGFAAAEGAFICLLDSDDYWERGKLKRSMPRFEDPGVGVVQHFLRDVTATGRAIRHALPPWPDEYGLEDLLDHRLQLTATSGLIFRKSVLNQILPLPKEIFYYLDDLLVAKALFLSKTANVPEVLGYHRLHGLNFCAGGYRSPDKLALDIQMRAIFNHEMQPWLSRYGKRFSRRYLIQEDLEYIRRRILLHMFRGERLQAWKEWRGLLRGYWKTRFGVFRAATCFLALISPQLYLSVYEFYARWEFISRLRLKTVPD